MVLRPSDIVGALIWTTIILAAIWLWISSLIYKRQMAKQRANTQRSKENHE
jgi:hypothetical protein